MNMIVSGVLVKEGENTMQPRIIVCTQLICNAPRLLCRLGERGISSVEQHGGIPFLLFTDFTTDLASLGDGLGASSSGVYCSLTCILSSSVYYSSVMRDREYYLSAYYFC